MKGAAVNRNRRPHLNYKNMKRFDKFLKRKVFIYGMGIGEQEPVSGWIPKKAQAAKKNTLLDQLWKGIDSNIIIVILVLHLGVGVNPSRAH